MHKLLKRYNTKQKILYWIRHVSVLNISHASQSVRCFYVLQFPFIHSFNFKMFFPVSRLVNVEDEVIIFSALCLLLSVIILCKRESELPMYCCQVRFGMLLQYIMQYFVLSLSFVFASFTWCCILYIHFKLQFLERFSFQP